MKPGEIWGYTNPATGEKRGVKVTHYFPPMGLDQHHIAWAHSVKGGISYCYVLTPEGIPMLKDGTASPNWKLIEK